MQFDEYCILKKITLTRYNFFMYKQKEGQPFDEFVTQLKQLLEDCEFKNLKYSINRDITVVGVIYDWLRERMLSEL